MPTDKDIAITVVFLRRSDPDPQITVTEERDVAGLYLRTVIKIEGICTVYMHKDRAKARRLCSNLLRVLQLASKLWPSE